ncbi:uncharacterized protein LOC141664347 [Apium graveolens]|uniref:uncharacterized protein LOC141664347 n=1 Tax=Apium graveolens TaxID=4045 RepID=UPI003D7B0980
MPRKRRVGKLPSKDRVCLTPKLQQEITKLGYRGSGIKEAEASALASAEAFKSDNPFFFHVMRRTYTDGRRHGLVVKKAFEESYKRWNNNDKVYLQVAGRSCRDYKLDEALESLAIPKEVACTV